VITPFTLRPFAAEAGSAKQRTTANAAQGRMSRFMPPILVVSAGYGTPPPEGFGEDPSIGRDYDPAVDLELSPVQPDAVATAIEALVVSASPEADPWWQAGLEQALTDET
jgi:hypothetical protein